MERLLSVVLHDAASATQPACERAVAAIREVAPGIPLTLLAVPRYHGRPNDPAFVDWLHARAAAGDEIALHGHTHLDEGEPHGLIDRLRRRVYTRGEGEFSDLARPEAELRLQAGMRWFDEHQLRLQGFVAPAWLMSAGAWQALAGARRLAYACTLGHLVLLPGGRRIASQSLVYSNATAWRRGMSRAWVGGIAALQRGRTLLRLELHPNDADDPRLRRHWQRLLERLLEERRALTLADAAARWRSPEPLAGLRTGRT